ncbi:DMT family transporter [Arundinibacter roseus]|uniref:DMT family transporter n=1 Tax=Arundinibacter roseus TaxID=2070510 RepID=A0A4R4JYP1_9BACT|nr:DMT family transporter [Arundinibacter roseus]TDB59121.1 DMT family transporter [Arundinibacter roseus]
MILSADAPYERPRSYYWMGALMVLVAAFCFACKGILIKMVYQEYPVDAIALLSLRMLFSLPFYVTMAWWLSKTTPGEHLCAREWLFLALVGITGYYVASYLNFLGLVYITASLERVLLFVYPTFVLGLGVVVFKRKIKPMQYGALLLTYAGIALAFWPNINSDQQKDVFLGAFWVLLSGLVYAVYLVGGDRIMARMGSQKFTCYAMIAATVPTVLHGLIQHGWRVFLSYPAPVYGISGIMAVFVTVFPTFLLAEGIRRIGSGNASILASIGPIFTIVLASVVLHEQIDFWQGLGTFLVLAGVCWIGWKGKKG